MIPPSTADGMLCSNELSLPITENTIAVAADMRTTCGCVIFVIDIAPVTSLYVVTGGPPNKAAERHANPSPNRVL